MRLPRHRAALVAALVALAAGAAVWALLARRDDPADDPRPDPPTPDPRAAFDTPFRNVRPGVAYVGDAACATCHADVARAYRQHPMGRSAEWVTADTAAKHTAGADNPFATGGYELRAERAGDRVRHTVAALEPPGGPLPPYALGANLALGSGHQGRSYVSADGGALWQSPLSWFRQGDRWAVSPGFEGATMRRPVAPGCLFCHTDRTAPVAGALNRYAEPLFPFQPSIGCERCHGPGALHAAERAAAPAVAKPDHSIVNPKHLPADLREDVCRQCHLQGETVVARRGREPYEFRPGLPWEQFQSVFLAPPGRADARRSVGQFEQMELSKCYTGSSGKLGCTSCHDPHAVPAPDRAAAHYRARCQTCHESRGCSAPAPQRAARADNCVACHMPARDSSNIVHAAVTDHRVPRRPGTAPAPPPVPGEPPLVAYAAGPHAPPSAERDRDRAVAFGQEVVRAHAGGSVDPELVRATRAQLEATLERWPGDAPAWGALAGVHLARRDPAAAVVAARRAVALAPDSDPYRARLVEAATAAEDFALAAAAAEPLVARNPGSADHRAALATALVCLKRWDRAEAEARAALAVHPLHSGARLIAATCRSRLGDPAAARTELDRALRFAPAAGRAATTDWFLKHAR